jgi:oxygen-dependent protoporphyrinogen oxidase
MPRIVVVGAGISGLALAFRLRRRQPGATITVLESAARAGGKIATETHDGFRVEVGPNGFLDTKPATLDLCRDLSLGPELITASESSRKNRFLFFDNRLQKLPGGPLGLLTTRLLSRRGKIDLIGEMFRKGRPAANDESVAAFFRRRLGRNAAAVLGDALVTGIHGGDPELLSVKAAFPRAAEMEAAHGSVIRGFLRTAKQKRRDAKARGDPPPKSGRMWSFRGGLQRMIDALVEHLPKKPVFGASVRRVERTDAGWTVRGDGQDAWPADAVVLACPADEQAAILADLDPDLANEIAGIAYNRIAVVAAGYRQADVPRVPDGFGYIAPQHTRRDLLGVQWCSAIYPDRAPPGCVLWRALCGGWNRPDIVDWDDTRLLTAVRAELHLAHGVTLAPIFSRIVRWPRAIPQYHVGHLARVARIESRAANWPGLHLTGNAYRGVALNDCTEQAATMAERIGG